MDRQSLVTGALVALAVVVWLVAAQYTDNDLVLWALLFGIGLGGPVAVRARGRRTGA